MRQPFRAQRWKVVDAAVGLRGFSAAGSLPRPGHAVHLPHLSRFPGEGGAGLGGCQGDPGKRRDAVDVLVGFFWLDIRGGGVQGDGGDVVNLQGPTGEGQTPSTDSAFTNPSLWTQSEAEEQEKAALEQRRGKSGALSGRFKKNWFGSSGKLLPLCQKEVKQKKSVLSGTTSRVQPSAASWKRCVIWLQSEKGGEILDVCSFLRH